MFARLRGVAVLVLAGALMASCSGAKTKTSTPTGATAPSGSATSAEVQPAASGASGDSSAAAAPSKSVAAATKPAPSKAPPKGAVNPNAPEVVEPGDIPDDKKFLPTPSADGSYTISFPEGWARSQAADTVTYTDHYNSITVVAQPASAPPTPDTVKSANLADVSVDPTFKLVDVKAVSRKAGPGVVALYEIGSAPNKVTGKKALLAVERYVFFHNGKDLILTLSGAKGADNVDPWKTVTDSLQWS